MTDKHVFVHNTSDAPLTDGWDGKAWTFAPGATVQVPEVVARHVFGYGIDDKSAVLARLGWAHTSKDVAAALERLAKFVITVAPQSKTVVPDMHDKVQVRNSGKETIVGMWDGKKYTFEPGSKRMIPIEVATVLFGHKLGDKSAALERLRNFNKGRVEVLLSSIEITEDHRTAEAA